MLDGKTITIHLKSLNIMSEKNQEHLTKYMHLGDWLMYGKCQSLMNG